MRPHTNLRLQWLCIVLAMSANAARASTSSDLHFSARAYDIDSGQIVYIEEHAYTDTGFYTVIYREPNGTKFANKAADFSVSRFAPNIEQHNDRNGEIIRIERKNNSTLTSTYRETRHKSESTIDIATTDATVIDAGFHPYILEHWNNLISGTIAHIDYVVPTWQRRVTLTLKSIPCAARHHQCFSIKPTNPLFAMLVTPIELTYDAHSHQLMEFSGTSNIAQHNGDYHRVRIVYEYPTISGVAKAAD